MRTIFGWVKAKNIPTEPMLALASLSAVSAARKQGMTDASQAQQRQGDFLQAIALNPSGNYEQMFTEAFGMSVKEAEAKAQGLNTQASTPKPPLKKK